MPYTTIKLFMAFKFCGIHKCDHLKLASVFHSLA